MNENNMNDIINNLKNMLNENNTISNSNSSNSNTTSNVNKDNSNPNISPEMFSNLISTFKESTSSHNTDNSEKTGTFNNIDIDTILKLKSIIETLNSKDDPRSNLLYSLKPYLRKSRQKKLDQYANLLKITEVTNLFKSEKGDVK